MCGGCWQREIKMIYCSCLRVSLCAHASFIFGCVCVFERVSVCVSLYKVELRLDACQGATGCLTAWQLGV